MQKTLCIKCKIVLNNFCYFTIIFHRPGSRSLVSVYGITEVLQAPFVTSNLPLPLAELANPSHTASLSAAAFTLNPEADAAAY